MIFFLYACSYGSLDALLHQLHLHPASGWSHNLSLLLWAIHSLMQTLLHSSGVFLVPTTNNQVKYDIVAGLLVGVITFSIHYLQVHLNHVLLVTQFNNFYNIENCTFSKIGYGLDLYHVNLIPLCSFIFIEVTNPT